MDRIRILALLTLILAPTLGAVAAPREEDQIGGGELRIVPPDGIAEVVCPLRHTEVDADIVGFVNRVRVRQVFYNPLAQKIEAVYVFPLPQDAAVDDMVMTVGDRRVVGQIKSRDDARETYEAARMAGHVAGLLDQERPNIFTQSVANIEPGVEVVIEISYVETLRYEDGEFQFVFPMVVGPRYIPGGGSAPAPMTTGKPTPQVPDGHKITPPVVPPGMRAGHDISLTVNVDAGIGIANLNSELHQVDIRRAGASHATVTLANHATIPNKDFILRYRADVRDVGDAFFTHADPRGTFFTMFLQPPRRAVPENIVPREVIFVLDTSGSMSGFPIEKAKAVMSRTINAMRPADTFNLITFAGNTRILWQQPRPNTPDNRAEAQAFLASRRGSGGTEMMKAINAALVQKKPCVPRPLTRQELLNLPADGRNVEVGIAPSDSQPGLWVRESTSDKATTFDDWWKQRLIMIRRPAGAGSILIGRWATENGSRVLVLDRMKDDTGQSVPPVRIVCFMTDGYVGNDMAIIEAVKKNADTTRVFSFGIGNSVNRFLLDGMAGAGRGEVEYVSLQSDGDAAVRRFSDRIDAPVLTDISIDWGSLKVADVHPQRIPDLFTGKPIMVHGRLQGPPSGTITLRGNTGVGPLERPIQVTPPGADPHDALASLWARAKIADLMMQDYAGLQHGQVSESLKSEITTLGIEYRLMTQFTSFVAVEEMTVTVAGAPTKITVPVEMPDGVSYEGVFGGRQDRGAGQVAMNAGFSRGRTASEPRRPKAPSGFAAVESRLGVLSPPPVTRAMVMEQVVADADAFRRDESEEDRPAKLSDALRGLAERVAADGLKGNLTIGTLRVVDFKVDVRVFLRDTSPATLKSLKDLGFVKTGESKAVRMLVGTIDVRKLIALAELDVVLRVTPASDN